MLKKIVASSSSVLKPVSLYYETIPINRNNKTPISNTTENPIIILHGLLGSCRTNRTLARCLYNRLGETSNNTKIYLPDLRNHGQSPHQDPHTYPMMTEDIIKFIKDNNIKKPINIIGHSMGGKVAMLLAIKRPDLCKSVISIDMPPLITNQVDNLSKYTEGMLNLLNKKIRNKRELDCLMQDFVPDPFIRGFLMMNLFIDKDTNILNSKINLKVIHDSIISHSMSTWNSNLLNTTRKSPVPLLMLLGSRSPYSNDPHLLAAEAAKYFMHSSTERVAGSHYINTEKPAVCSDLIAPLCRER